MNNIRCEFPYNDHKHIALVQLNRPKVLNALSTDLMRELVDKLFELDDNPDVRVIILTGNERAFAAGADIAQMVEATPIDQINDNRFPFLATTCSDHQANYCGRKWLRSRWWM